MKRYLSIFLALAVLAACQTEEPLLTGPVGGNGQEETGGNGGGDNSGNGDEGNGDEGGENGGGNEGGGDVIPPATTGYAWFELPVITDKDKDGKIDGDGELYYAHHICADTLYEVVGCYFEKYTDAYSQTCEPKTIYFGGRSDVSCPTMFYYAVLRTKAGNSGKSVLNCSASELKCAAFVLRHNIEKSHKPQAKDIISIAELEKITGFTYFPNVPNAPKSTVNVNEWL